MIKVGLTGNIASGKSCVENFLVQMSYKVYDADSASHKILEESLIIKQIFGTNKREELAKTVFSDKNKLKKLEDIIHPLIRQEIISFFDKNCHEKIVFASVPLLFEAGFEDLFDKIIFVFAPDEIRLNRLMERNSYTKDYALLRMNSQMPQEEKLKRSDFVINNDKSLDELKNAVRECLELLE